jgi:hypothetical protein
VQILGPGEKVEVEAGQAPADMHDGMEDEDRAAIFAYWARFRDSRWRSGRRPTTPGRRSCDTGASAARLTPDPEGFENPGREGWFASPS